MRVIYKCDGNDWDAIVEHGGNTYYICLYNGGSETRQITDRVFTEEEAKEYMNTVIFNG